MKEEAKKNLSFEVPKYREFRILHLLIQFYLKMNIFFYLLLYCKGLELMFKKFLRQTSSDFRVFEIQELLDFFYDLNFWNCLNIYEKRIKIWFSKRFSVIKLKKFYRWSNKYYVSLLYRNCYFINSSYQWNNWSVVILCQRRISE